MLLEFGSLTALYVAARLRFDAALARVAVLRRSFCLRFSPKTEMVHYSSERLSIFLSTFAVALLAWRCARGSTGAGCSRLASWPGRCLLAKLQSVPLAAGVAAISLAVVFGSRQLSLRTKAIRALQLAGGLVLVPAVTLGVVAAAGALRDFWISYIQMALAYILFDYEPFTFLTGTREAGPLIDVLLVTTLAGAIALALFWKRVAPPQRYAFLAALALLAAAIYTVYSPKRGTVHYVLFAVLPAAFCATVALGMPTHSSPAARVRRAHAAAFAGGLVVASLLATSAFSRPWYPYVGAVANYYYGARDPLDTLMKRYLRPETAWRFGAGAPSTSSTPTRCWVRAIQSRSTTSAARLQPVPRLFPARATWPISKKIARSVFSMRATMFGFGNTGFG